MLLSLQLTLPNQNQNHLTASSQLGIWYTSISRVIQSHYGGKIMRHYYSLRHYSQLNNFLPRDLAHRLKDKIVVLQPENFQNTQ